MILSGFLLASVLAVPLGILMGSFKVVEAFIEPITGFMRYLPVSAMIPLLILWIGIGIEQKIAVIFIGTFFQQLILIADVSARVSKDLIDVSYTLGASRRQVVTRVLFPACLPGVMDNLRVTMGWAWTYLVVAELVAANSGLGYMILNAMRGLFTDVIILGIVVIGILGPDHRPAVQAAAPLAAAVVGDLLMLFHTGGLTPTPTLPRQGGGELGAGHRGAALSRGRGSSGAPGARGRGRPGPTPSAPSPLAGEGRGGGCRPRPVGAPRGGRP